MKFRMTMAVAVAAVALSATAALDESERSAVRKSAAVVEAKLKTATALDGKEITLLPVKGDSDGFCERLLIGALVNAGKTCVVSNDEKNDERFARILKEIKWDEAQTTLKTIDPKTADELGHLKSTQILLEARLDVFRRGKKRIPVAELGLLAYEVKTKRYLWTATVAVDEVGASWPDPSEYNVKVSFTGIGDAEAVAGVVGGVVRDTLAGYRYRVNGEGEVDLEVAATFAQQTFDKSGEYIVLKGVVHGTIASKSGDGVLYEKTFEAKGKRGLGMDAAVMGLASELSAKIRKWVEETLEPRVFFEKHRDFAAQR